MGTGLGGYAEQQAVLERAKTNLLLPEGRVYDFIPEEEALERDDLGITALPYIILSFGELTPKAGDRSIEGYEQQPFIMPIIFECWASTSDMARRMGAEVRQTFVGWAPDLDNAEPIDLRGGNWFDRRDSSGRPTRQCVTVTGVTSVNNSIEVLIPGLYTATYDLTY